MKGKFLGGLIGLALLGTAGAAHATLIAFEFTGGAQQFIVGAGITSVNVLAIGGGGGGANGHQGGGGAGFLSTGTFAVSPGDIIPITVGTGGTGALDAFGSNQIVGLTAGGTSSFGTLLSAAGGSIVTGVNLGGHNGSSGGGAACNGGSVGGNGGSGGSNGQSCQSGNSMPIGLGQGDYTSLLSIFNEAVITAGFGGLGGTGSHAGGGGAGGILINGGGPGAENGNAFFSAQGGSGYGAGGGAGGLDFSVNNTRFGGGDGANGLVFLEFQAISVPAPGTIGQIAFGLLCVMTLIRRRVRMS